MKENMNLSLNETIVWLIIMFLWGGYSYIKGYERGRLATDKYK
jgi:hypothetical protein